MEAARTRTAAFFIQYLTLLLAALVWVQFGFIQRRMHAGDLPRFYLLLGTAALCLGLRAWLVLGKRVSPRWSGLWLAWDLAIITGSVYLTGRIDSEAALLFLWPIVTSSIRRLPRRTIAVSAATAVLYVVATWPDHGSEKYWGTLLARMIVLLLATSLAVYYARTESALIEEVSRLREEVALSDYRNRLSQEMHDGIQQYLASIAVRLELARRLADTDPAEAARVAVDQRFAVRQAGAELRYLVRLLRSPALEREGFVEALRHHLSLFAEGATSSVVFEVKGEAVAPSPAVAQAALRVVQEALMNAAKHAQAAAVAVTLSFGDDRLECVIKDNGVGFDPAALPEEAGSGVRFGLSGMVQRAASVGGRIELSSAPGKGTVVTLIVPSSESTGASGKEAGDAQDQTADC